MINLALFNAESAGYIRQKLGGTWGKRPLAKGQFIAGVIKLKN